jgi:hypothetical protein
MSDVQIATLETTELLRRLGLIMVGSLLIEFIARIAVTFWVVTHL